MMVVSAEVSELDCHSCGDNPATHLMIFSDEEALDQDEDKSQQETLKKLVDGMIWNVHRPDGTIISVLVAACGPCARQLNAMHDEEIRNRH